MLGALVAAASTAWADGEAPRQVVTRRECVAAAEATQTLRDSGRLRAARAQSLMCSRPECPAALRHDCGGWLLQIEDSMPTAVFRAVDGNGKDLTDVRVDVDGEPLLTAVDGRAVPVDPGPHRFSFTARGVAPVAEDVVIAQGEKNRRVVVRLVPKTVPAAPAATDPAASVASPPSAIGGRGVAFWTATTAGVIGLAGLTIFGVSALSKSHELSTSCAPSHTCTQADHDSLRSRALIADVSGGVLIVSAAVALWLGLRGPGNAAASAPASLARPWGVVF